MENLRLLKGNSGYFMRIEIPLLCTKATIYTTKIEQFVCPPNISETVAVRAIKLAHRPRIASATIKLISKPILLSIL